MLALGAFPSESVLMETYNKLFEAGKFVVVSFMPGLMMIRALWTMFTSRGSAEQTEIIKDTFVTIILLACFMQFIQVMIRLPASIGDLFPESGTYAVKIGDEEQAPWNDFFSYVTIICYWIAVAIYAVLLMFISAIGAYLIGFGTMMRAYWVPKALFWGIILISSWPLLWYSLNLAVNSIAVGDGWVNGIIATIVNVVKAILPILGAVAALKHRLAQAAQASVGAAAKIAGGVVGGTASAATKTLAKTGGQPLINKVNGFKQGAKDKLDSGLKQTLPTIGRGMGLAGRLAASPLTRLSKSGRSSSATSKSSARSGGPTFTSTQAVSPSSTPTSSKITIKEGERKLEVGKIPASQGVVQSAKSNANSQRSQALPSTSALGGESKNQKIEGHPQNSKAQQPISNQKIVVRPKRTKPKNEVKIDWSKL